MNAIFLTHSVYDYIEFMVSEKGKYVEEDLSSAVQCDQSQCSSSFTIGEKGEIGSLAF